MKKSGLKLLKLSSLVILLLAIPVIALYHYKAEALAWHLLQSTLSNTQADSALHFEDYRVKVEAREITEIDDISGLTYNTSTNTLFTVLNNEPLIIELDLQGNLLRKIAVDGVRDMEGITYVDGNRYVLADEYDQRLVLVEINAETERIDTGAAPQISLDLSSSGKNKGFEGVSWDERNERLLVVKERNPLRVIEISGFVDSSPGGLHISLIRPAGFPNFRLRDFSSITYHDASGHMVLLSDESRMAVEYTFDGYAVSVLSLWRGFHGLQQHVPQAEGIAIGPDDTIYVISEPNLFYVFAK